MLVFAWLVGLMVAGNAVASADIIVGPDLAGGSAPTLFEKYSFLDYELTIKPSNSSQEGLFEMEAMMYQIIAFFNNVLLWIILGIVYGGLVLLEWFLGLTLYEDSASQIDQATRMIADHVFWPLIGVTAAIGAFMAYAKWRGDGRGFGSDMLWVVAAVTIGAGFAAGPSTIMNPVDEARQTLGNGIVAGASHFVHNEGNPTGYPAPTIPGNSQNAGTRRLVNSLWSTYGATPWCYAQFRTISICRKAGHHMLAGDQWWQDRMEALKDNKNPPVFGKHVDYIRGEKMARTGILLLMLGLALPLGLMLVWLVVKGLVAVVGLLLMLILGLVFLTFWCIDGFFRQLGIRYWVYTLGLALQTLFITVVIAGVMVVSSIIASQVGQYGFFLVSVFNIALFWAAVKARGWLEMLTSVGGAGTMGYGTVAAARMITRTITRTVSMGTAAAGGAALGARKGAGAAARGASQTGPTWAGAAARRSGMSRAGSPVTPRSSARLWNSMERDARTADQQARSSPDRHARKASSFGQDPATSGVVHGMAVNRMSPTQGPQSRAERRQAQDRFHRARMNALSDFGDENRRRPRRGGPPPPQSGPSSGSSPAPRRDGAHQITSAGQRRDHGGQQR